MNELDPRIFNRVEGFWSRTPLTPKERQAWAHTLAAFDADEVLDALDAYVNEGHTQPPYVGQLVARINPPDPNKSFRMSVADRRKDWLLMLCEMARGGDNRAHGRIPLFLEAHPELAELVPEDLRA